MGDSMVETQNMENKMGSRGTFGVSVSFGKYENDALSWEKWSTFSPNKYLEEVGKCSTPGSVAQKKAFFEAHYKKIAAMKAEAELLDQEKATPLTSDDHTEEEIKEQHKDNFIQSKACLNVEQMQAEILKFDGSGKPQEDSYQSRCKEDASLVKDESYQSQCKKEEASLVNDERFQDESLQSCNALEPQNLLQSQSPITLNSNADKLEEAVLVNDENMKLVKQHFQVDLETRGPQESKPEIPKLKPQNVLRKVNPTIVEKNSTGMKKKPASIVPKSPETSATRLSKPKATPTSSLKKANASSSSSSKSKNHLVSESKRVAPTSLHLSMSMSMNSVNSDTASSVTSSRRRSLFMEQMGDKDIVKRAFKTFQNRVNQLPSFDSGTKQLPAKGSETKASTSRANQKENERSRKAAEKITPARGQLGPTWKSVSSGSLKGVGVDERRIKATPNSVVLTSNERRKEFFKNLEEKSNAREAEKRQLSSKSKQVKDAEMKTLRQNLNFKAKPMPSFYRAQGVSSKSTSEKEATKQTRCM